MIINIGVNLSVADGFGEPGEPDFVWVTKTSMLTNRVHTIRIDNVRLTEVANWLTARRSGKREKLVQNAFPQLSAAEREFLMTGITADEWKTHLRFDEESNDE